MFSIVSSLLSVTVSAALFGRGGRDDVHGELPAERPDSTPWPAGPGTSTPPDAPVVDGSAAAPADTGEASDPPYGPIVGPGPADLPPVPPAPPAPPAPRNEAPPSPFQGPPASAGEPVVPLGDPDGPRLLAPEQRASLAARQGSVEPSPHPVRARELWHPTITLPEPSAVEPPMPPPTSPTTDPGGSGTGRGIMHRLRKVGGDGANAATASSAPVGLPAPPPSSGHPSTIRPGRDGDSPFDDLFAPSRASTREIAGFEPIGPGGDHHDDLLHGPVGRSRQMGGRGRRGVLPVLGMTADDLDHEWIRGAEEPLPDLDGAFDEIHLSPEGTTDPDEVWPPAIGADVGADARPDPVAAFAVEEPSRLDVGPLAAAPVDAAPDADLAAEPAAERTVDPAPGTEPGDLGGPSEEPAVPAPNDADRSSAAGDDLTGAPEDEPAVGAPWTLSLVPTWEEIDGDTEVAAVEVEPNEATVSAPTERSNVFTLRPEPAADEPPVRGDDEDFERFDLGALAEFDLDEREPFVAVRPLWIEPDGAVPTESGSVRVGLPDYASARLVDNSIEIELEAGWCWVHQELGGAPVVVDLGESRITVPTSTTALAAIDEGAKLVVVLQGEAVLVHPSGRMRLRSGAMVFLPTDAEPQVDVASDEELRADPIVAHNLDLDARRGAAR